MEKTTALLKIALRRNVLYIPDSMVTQRAIQPGTLELVVALHQHSFGVTEDLLHAINGTSNEYRQLVVRTIKQISNIKLNWAPLIKNWEVPIRESAIDHITATFYNQFPDLVKNDDYTCYWYDYDDYYEADDIKNYNREYFTPKHEHFLACEHYVPYGTFPLRRYNGCPFCGTPFQLGRIECTEQGSKLKILDLWCEQNANAYYQNLLASRTALGATRVDSLKRLSSYSSMDKKTTIEMKETLILVVDSYLLSEDNEVAAGTRSRAPTNILRYLRYKKARFLQLLPPETVIVRSAKNYSHIVYPLNKNEEAEIEAREELRLKYSRKECTKVARWLNTLSLSAEKAYELMHPKREVWVRFIHALRLVECGKEEGSERLVMPLDIFYHQKYEV